MSKTKVLIPTPLRQYVNKLDYVEVEGKTISEILDNLTSSYKDLRRHLFTDDGLLRNFVNIYVNDEDIRYLMNQETSVNESDIVTIVPAVAGGNDLESLGNQVRGLNSEEIMRYSRHLIMPEVGMDGQVRLKKASVMIIGAGGLGSPTSIYLAASGIGRIGLVDFDVIEFSNLQRQIIHSTRDVGKPKLDSAKESILAVNPSVQVDTYNVRLTSDNALEILKGYDVVIDGTDNFATRYLVNDACVFLDKPNVYGSIFRFEGQASVFDAKVGPCYRCLYPEPPPPGLVPSCAEGGVLGVLPGLIGMIQATEAIKIIIGVGEPLIGRLLLYDALKMKIRELKLKKDPACPVCSEKPTITSLIDYEEFCGIRRESGHQVQEVIPEITVQELHKQLEAGEQVKVVDVREPVEYQISHLKGATLIPLGDLAKRVNELDSAENIVVHCHVGGRSAQATSFLKNIGFSKVKNLRGGIDAWSLHIDPSVPRY